VELLALEAGMVYVCVGTMGLESGSSKEANGNPTCSCMCYGEGTHKLILKNVSQVNFLHFFPTFSIALSYF
jgi:hypothetical protein